MITNSQAYQDLFALISSKFKINGTFIDIGANDPSFNSNSYMLESKFQWRGVLVEYQNFADAYKQKRPGTLYYISDAQTLNYKYVLDSNSFSKSMDYLSIDLDVNNKSTLNTLVNLDDTVFDIYKFAAVTFEHDIYTGDFFDTRKKSREIFEKRGYTLVFPDVSVYWEGTFKMFEDWYLHPDLVDVNLITKWKQQESRTCEEIKTIMLS